MCDCLLAKLIHIDKQNKRNRCLIEHCLKIKNRGRLKTEKQVFRRPLAFPLNPIITPTIVPTKPVSTMTAFSGFLNRG
ncbi:hypothetical protein [Neisseria sicca]|uniref:hypothetical protein n=1 Tax=Neisseria sicca TaxID=490 RepID=UPI0011BD0378|nr:hypothetical protein [Neisseria sicca]